MAELVASVTAHGSEQAMSYRAFFNYMGSVSDNVPVDAKTLTDVYQVHLHGFESAVLYVCSSLDFFTFPRAVGAVEMGRRVASFRL